MKIALTHTHTHTSTQTNASTHSHTWIVITSSHTHTHTHTQKHGLNIHTLFDTDHVNSTHTRWKLEWHLRSPVTLCGRPAAFHDTSDEEVRGGRTWRRASRPIRRRVSHLVNTSRCNRQPGPRRSPQTGKAHQTPSPAIYVIIPTPVFFFYL